MYANGLGVQKNAASAVQWYSKAAQQGDASAQYNLGLMYANGQGVSKDYAIAAKWYRKAAEQGLPEAMFNLGVAYLNGAGVQRSDKAAAGWYYKAGVAYLKQGGKENALAAVNSIKKVAPGHRLAKQLTKKIHSVE
jgi:TPR repeat protein